MTYYIGVIKQMAIKHFSLRIDENLLAELHYVSKYNGRSANNEILQLIRAHIGEFEKQHGDIMIEDWHSRRNP